MFKTFNKSYFIEFRFKKGSVFFCISTPYLICLMIEIVIIGSRKNYMDA
ncbi:DUF226 domain-containing protein [Borreliella burgdorferi]